MSFNPFLSCKPRVSWYRVELVLCSKFRGREQSVLPRNRDRLYRTPFTCTTGFTIISYYLSSPGVESSLSYPGTGAGCTAHPSPTQQDLPSLGTVYQVQGQRAVCPTQEQGQAVPHNLHQYNKIYHHQVLFIKSRGREQSVLPRGRLYVPHSLNLYNKIYHRQTTKTDPLKNCSGKPHGSLYCLLLD